MGCGLRSPYAVATDPVHMLVIRSLPSMIDPPNARADRMCKLLRLLLTILSSYNGFREKALNCLPVELLWSTPAGMVRTHW